MADSSLSVGALILCMASFLRSATCNGDSQKHATLFVFGDSLFDAGNNNYIKCGIGNQANFWPYGETFFKYPTGRFCDGRVLPDFIAEYAKLPLIPPFLQPGLHQFTYGANFASGGAGALVETHPGTINLKMQLENFKKVEKSLRQKLGSSETTKILSRAVYLFSIGGNDYHDVETIRPYKEEYIALVIGNITMALKEIHRKGGRKFGFQNVAPMGCIPATMQRYNSSGCVKEPSAVGKLHNIGLSEALRRLENQLEGFKYSIFDYHTALSERTNYPSKYGFKEGKTACCGSGPHRAVNSCGGKRGVKQYHLCSNTSEYVWFDFAHTSETANRQLAQLMWSGPPHVTGPYNIQALFQML